MLQREVQHELVTRAHHPAEAQPVEAAEQWQLADIAGISEEGDGPGLGQSLELQHSGKDGVAGEVAGQERLVAAHRVARTDPLAGHALVHDVDEPERRAVRQQRDVRVARDISHRELAARRRGWGPRRTAMSDERRVMSRVFEAAGRLAAAERGLLGLGAALFDGAVRGVEHGALEVVGHE